VSISFPQAQPLVQSLEGTGSCVCEHFHVPDDGPLTLVGHLWVSIVEMPGNEKKVKKSVDVDFVVFYFFVSGFGSARN
jgi:hypothetical protein